MKNTNPQAALEHINITVSDPKAMAARLCELLGWHIRWFGPSMNGGTTYHVGSKDSYLALYTRANIGTYSGEDMIGHMSHIGITVPDLAALARKILALGFTPYYFGDYTPGQRFYVRLDDNIEFEFISYEPQKSDWWNIFQTELSNMSKAGIARK